MSNDIILFVVEGEKDCEIINSIVKSYDIDDTKTQPIIYRSNIYQLFNVLQNAIKEFDGEDESDFEILNTFQVLKDIATNEDRKKMTYEETDISEIHLFFDLDAHTNQARKLDEQDIPCIEKMLSVFYDEFEQGKLYISYPMVEAYKHPFNQQNFVSINNKPKYKTLVSNLCNQHGIELNDISKIDKELWDKTLTNHLKSINDLLYHKLDIPDTYQPIDFSQEKIYQKQLTHNIEPNQQVRVISPFCLFLLDFLGTPLLKEWNVIDD